MERSSTLNLPSRKDWVWALALALLGAGLSFGLNALHLPRYQREGGMPAAIDLKIALASEEEAPAAEAAPGPSPAPAAPGAPSEGARP